MTTYCPACGISVRTNERNEAGKRLWCCESCGLALKEEDAPQNVPAVKPERVLGRMPLARMTAAEALAAKQELERRTAESAERLPWEDSSPQVRPRSAAPPPAEPEPLVLAALFERVVVADDTELIREMVRDALVQNGVSHDVHTCANGEECLQVLGEQLARRQKVDLIVLDVEMPVLNGYSTAISLRAFERGLRQNPTPILFFSSRVCDETFRKVLEHCQPARYLNKGADGSPPRIAERLAQVLSTLRK